MAYSDQVLADAPQFYWRLDEASGNFADSSGHGFTATAVGTPGTYQQPPGISTGFSLLGADLCRAAYTTANVPFTDPNVWTLEAWIKTISTSGSIFIECARDSPSLGIIATTGLVGLNRSHFAEEGQSTVAVNNGQWHHIVARRNGAGTSKIFIDAIDRSGTMADNTFSTHPENRIGFGGSWFIDQTGPDAGTFFTGYLDEVAIYDSWLSDARITAHFNAGQAQAPDVLSMQSHVFGHNMW